MKTRFLFLAAALACAVAQAEVHTIAYWPFGESGLNDASGNGHTLSGGATLSDCATFGGTAETLLQTTSALDLSGYDNVTVEFFARVKDSANVAMLMEHSSAQGKTDVAGVFCLDINERDVGEHRVAAIFQAKRVYGNYLDTACIDSDSRLLQDGLWHHVALVIKSKSTAAYSESALSDWCISLYIDGKISKQYKRTALTAAKGGVDLQSGILYIGSRFGTQFPLVGDLDDIRITEGALSTEEFLKERTSASSAAIVARYPFGSEGLADVSGNDNHLHASTGVTLADDGAVATEGGLKFFQTRKPIDLREYEEGLTVQFQFKADASLSDATRTLLYFAQTKSGSTEKSLSIQLKNGIVYSLAKPDADSINADSVKGSFADGQWHHVAWVYDPYQSDDTAKLYVDGTNVGIADGGNATMKGLGKGFLSVGIGNAAHSAYGFSGEIDDVCVTGSALKPQDFALTRTTEAGEVKPLPELEPFTLAHWKFSRHAELADEESLYPLVETRANEMAFKEGAAVFNGMGGLKTASRLDLSPYRQLTVEFYFQYPSWREGDKDISMGILELSSNMNNNNGAFRLASDAGYVNDPGLFGALFKTPDGYSGDMYTSPVYGDSKWHHCAYLIDLSGQKSVTELYVDGVKVPHDARSFNKTGLTGLSSSHELYFGGRWASTVASWKDIGALIGRMDDVRISVGLLPADDWLQSRSAEAQPVGVPFARWDFEGANPLADVSGNGRNLSRSGQETFHDGIVELSGNKSGLYATSFACGSLRAFTMEMVVRNDRPYEADAMLFQLGSDFTQYGSSQFFGTMGTGGVKAGYLNCIRALEGRVVNAGEWTHLAFVSDFDASRSTDRVTLYVNGERAAEATNKATPNALRNDQTLFFGTKDLTDQCMAGAFADICFSEGALDPETFALRRPDPFSGPVMLYWPFNAHPYKDESGNGYELSANAAVDFNEEGFARLASGGVLKSLSYLPFNTCTNGLTIECWARFDAAPYAGSIIKTTASAVNDVAGALGMNFFSGVLYGRWITGFIKDSAGTVTRLDNLHSNAGDTANLADGKWHHFALVVDPSGNMAERSRLYVDFRKMAVVSGRDADLARAFSNGFLCVGGDGFAGSIDDVRVTAAALEPQQFIQKRSRRPGLVLTIR